MSAVLWGLYKSYAVPKRSRSISFLESLALSSDMLIVTSFSSQPPYHPYAEQRRSYTYHDVVSARQYQDRLNYGRVTSAAVDIEELFAGLHHQRAHRQQLHNDYCRRHSLDLLAQQQRQRQLQLVARRRQELAQEFEQRQQAALEARRQQYLQRQRLSHELTVLAHAMEAMFSQAQRTEQGPLASEVCLFIKSRTMTQYSDWLHLQVAGTVPSEHSLKRCGAVRRGRCAESAPAPSPSPAVPGVPTTSTSVPLQAQSSPPVFSSLPEPVASVVAESVRIPIVASEDKEKASSHVDINSATTSSGSPSAVHSTLPAVADAQATLNILSSDLDGYLSSSHVWPSPAHRIHALNQLLEQVDAVESDGEDAIRQARRGLVLRVEQALDGQQELEAVETNSPITQRAEVEVDQSDVAQSSNASLTELTGYDVPDVHHDSPLATSTPVGSPVSSGAAQLQAADSNVRSEWTTFDPTVSQPLGLEPEEDENSTHIDAPETATSLAASVIQDQIEPVDTSLSHSIPVPDPVAAAEDTPSTPPALDLQEQRLETKEPSPLEVVAGAPLAASETSSPTVSNPSEQADADLAEWDTDSESGEDVDADAFELV